MEKKQGSRAEPDEDRQLSLALRASKTESEKQQKKHQTEEEMLAEAIQLSNKGFDEQRVSIKRIEDEEEEMIRRAIAESEQQEKERQVASKAKKLRLQQKKHELMEEQ